MLSLVTGGAFDANSRALALPHKILLHSPKSQVIVSFVTSMLQRILFYLSFLLILFLPISNLTYAKDVAESSHKIEHGDTKTLEKKFPSEQFECIGDFLVKAGHAKTKITAHKQKKTWKMERVIIPQIENESSDLIVFEPEMAEVMGNVFANECFKRNWEVVEFGTWEPEKHNERAEVWEPFIRIGPLWRRSKDGRGPFSIKLGKKLGAQSDCLANFLANSSSLDHLEMLKAPWIPNDAEGAILRGNLLHKNWWYFDMNVLRWMWKVKKEKKGKNESEQREERELMMMELTQNMKNMSSIMSGQENELQKCEKILPIKREPNPEYGPHHWLEENAALLRSLLKRFPEDQFFVKKFPKRMVESIATGHVCVICQDEFEPEEKGEMLRHCGHFYHKKCINPWFHRERKNNCPSCKRKILFRADGK